MRDVRPAAHRQRVERSERALRVLPLAGEESAASWREVVTSLVARHLARPVLAVIDGNPGLRTALQAEWPGIEIQRCTAHKLRNLQAKAPARLREELTEDYRRMIYAETASAVEQARTRFTKQWRLAVEAAGIKHRYIKPRRPQQNGKVERSHRIDQEEFWSRHAFDMCRDAEVALAKWERAYNHDRFSVALRVARQ